VRIGSLRASESVGEHGRVQVGTVRQRFTPQRHRQARIVRGGVGEGARGFLAVVGIIKEEAAVEGGLSGRYAGRNGNVHGRGRRCRRGQSGEQHYR